MEQSLVGLELHLGVVGVKIPLQTLYDSRKAKLSRVPGSNPGCGNHFSFFI